MNTCENVIEGRFTELPHNTPELGVDAILDGGLGDGS